MTMAEYIEREALKAKFMEHYSSEYPAALVLALIDNQPTADVVEVRHCEQCKYFTKTASEYPCSHCKNCYTDKFKPKMELGDDEE